MAYLDYSPVVLPDQSEGLRRIGDALEAAMRRRDQRRQFEETQKFQREQEQRRYTQMQGQIDYQNRLAAAKEARDQRDFQMRQDAVNQAKAEAVMRSKTAQEAAAKAAGISVYGGEGEKIGQGSLEAGPLADIGPEPTLRPAPKPDEAAMGAAVPDMLQALRGVPGAFRNTPGLPPEIAARMKGLKRPAPEPGAVEGPQLPSADAVRSAEIQRIATQPDTEEVPDIEASVADAEQARAAQLEQVKRYESQFEPYRQEMERPRIPDAMAAAERFRADNDAFQAESAAYPEQRATYAAKLRRAEDERPYELSIPGQAPINFDFRTQRMGARQADADDFIATVGQLPLSPADQEAARIGHALIMSGQDKQKVLQQFQAERTLGTKQRFASALQTQKDEAAYERAKLPRPGITLQTQKFDFEQDKLRSGNLRKDLENFVKRFDAKTIQDDNLAAPRIKADLNSGNPQRQRNAMIELWRMAQHDNRMSDRDAIMAQTVDPSWLAVIENAVSTKSTGVLSDDVRNTALATVDGFAKALGDKTAEMRSLAKRNFIDSGEYNQHEADVLLGLQMPGWTRLFPDEPKLHGEPPEVKAKRKAKAGGKTTVKAPTVEEAEKALQLLQGPQ